MRDPGQDLQKLMVILGADFYNNLNIFPFINLRPYLLQKGLLKVAEVGCSLKKISPFMFENLDPHVLHPFLLEALFDLSRKLHE